MENRRNSKIKRVRKSGFRARMRTSKGRNIINKRRSSSRRITMLKHATHHATHR